MKLGGDVHCSSHSGTDEGPLPTPHKPRPRKHRRIQELHLGEGKSSAEGASVEAWCGEGVSPQREVSVEGQCPSQENFLHFHVEMAHFGGILAINFKFYSMNKTVNCKSRAYTKIQQRATFCISGAPLSPIHTVDADGTKLFCRVGGLNTNSQLSLGLVGDSFVVSSV